MRAAVLDRLVKKLVMPFAFIPRPRGFIYRRSLKKKSAVSGRKFINEISTVEASSR